MALRANRVSDVGKIRTASWSIGVDSYRRPGRGITDDLAIGKGEVQIKIATAFLLLPHSLSTLTLSLSVVGQGFADQYLRHRSSVCIAVTAIEHTQEVQELRQQLAA
ncbi:hypothetical protein PIB30_047486 [Stylosanthes scabra]|uniref:Uncharacterized protein n=1 Tax=Stylosanthes scabra TaxID=79078 RepID=A0ABU6SGV3_9FABA|nr:hypothetical protein [Stylosanthes scabra]